MTKKIPCEVYSRSVGYLRPVGSWNDGKQQEFKDRKTYKLERTEDDEDRVRGRELESDNGLHAD